MSPLCLLPLFLLLSLPSLILSDLPPSVSTPSCDKSLSVVNDLHHLPRLNFQRSLINPDLASYEWYTCTPNPSDPSDPSCEWFDPFSSITALYGTAPSSTSPINFLQSYGVYVAFGILMAIVSLCLGLGLCIGRYCCCCIKGGTCGKRWPTIRTRCCGMQGNLVTGAMEYSRRERWCARGYMAVFIIFVVVWILMSYTAGTGSIPSSMKSVANAPAPFVETVQGLAVPVRDLIISLASHTVTDLINQMNATITEAVDLTALVDDMTCIVNTATSPLLPNTTTILSVITSLQSSLGGVNATLASAPLVMSSLTAQMANVSAGIGQVQGDLAVMANDIQSSITAMQAVSTSLAVFSVFTANVTDPTNGASAIASDLGSLTTSLPSSSDVSTADTDLSAVGGAGTYTVSQLRQMELNLVAINTSYSTSPNFARTSEDLVQLQADVATLDSTNIIGIIAQQINISESALHNITTDISNTNGTLTAVAGSAVGVNVTGAVTLLMSIEGIVGGVEAQLFVVDELVASIPPLLAVLPCMFSALDMAVTFNATLLELPSDFDVIVTLAPSLNSSLVNALSSFNTVGNELDSFQTQLSNLSISTYLYQIDNMTALASSAASNLTSGPSSAVLTSALNSTQAANFSGLAQLDALNATVNSIPFNTSLNADLTELQQFKDNALGLLSEIIPDLIQLDTYGYCVNNGGTCTTNTDCPSSTCASVPSSGTTVPVTKRCRLYGNIPCTAGDGACTAPGDRCLVDAGRYNYLIGNMTAIQLVSPASSDTSALIAQLNLAVTQSSPSGSGLSSINSSIAATVSGLQGVDLSTVNASLASVASSLTTFDVNGVLTQVSSIQSALGGVNLSPAQSAVSSLGSSLDQVDADVADIEQAQQLVVSLRNLLYYEMHVYLSEISPPNLLSAYSHGGLTAMANVLLSLVDNATLYLNDSQYIQPTNLTSLITSDIARYLDALSTSTYSSHGPLYFIGILALQSQTLDLTLFNQAETARVDVDVNGMNYPNNTYCLTTSCVDASVDYYTSSSLQTVSSGSIPVSLSGLQALSIPLVIPAVIAILCLVSMLCVKSTPWASCCSSCSACLMFGVMPFIFVLIGMVWPIIVLGMADACNGGVSVGNQYVLQQSASLCGTLSGNSTGTLCTITQYNVTFTFDIAEVYQAVLGDTCSASNDPLQSTWQQLAETVATYPQSKADDAVNNLNTGSSEIRIRPALLNLVYGAANSSGKYFETAVVEAGQLLGCVPLSAAFQDVKGSLCCDTATTLYWAIGAWYLLAFSMLLCGWGAAVMGRKRFGNQLWGPGTDALHTENVTSHQWGNRLRANTASHVCMWCALLCCCCVCVCVVLVRRSRDYP